MSSSLSNAGRTMIGGFERPWRGVLHDTHGRFVATLHNRLARRECRFTQHTVIFDVATFDKIVMNNDALEIYDRDTGDTLRFDCKKRGWYHFLRDHVYVDLTAWDEFESGER